MTTPVSTLPPPVRAIVAEARYRGKVGRPTLVQKARLYEAFKYRIGQLTQTTAEYEQAIAALCQALDY